MQLQDNSFALRDLARIIENRKTAPSEGSYTAMLLKRGEVAIRNKLLEEVAELIIESRRGDAPRVADELADVFYLALVLASHHGVSLEEVEKRLASRHAKGKVESEAGSSAAAVLRRLAPFLLRPGKVSFSRLSKATGFEASDGADIVLFSPFLKAAKPSRVNVRSNEFPQENKALKTLLEKHELKVKMGIQPGESARYVTRRLSNSLSAIIFVAKPVVLPLAVKLLVDYLRDCIDKRGNETAVKSKTAIHLIVAADGSIKEQTFVLEGTPESVHGELGKIQSDIPAGGAIALLAG
jgi:phosphoribosyl-ATP pyrophosphohydrolase